uniref:Gingipain domain-containing protein n=1 Tax=candidate division WOR-3 bacterium TaxID=2052148 RepID=A0A7C3J5N5_UNCW3
MKKILSLILLFFFLSVFPYQINLENDNKSFEVFSTNMSKKFILNYDKYLLLIHQKDLEIEKLKFLTLSCGYQYIDLVNDDPSYYTVKNLIDSIKSIKRISSVILVGDENRINPYRGYFNPYTLKNFPSDIYFSNPFEDSSFVLIFRIPVSNQEQLNNYVEKLKNFLIDNSNFDFIFTAPFYDYNNDSTEDYLYFTYPYFINRVLKGKIYGETNSIFPKYTFTYEKLPDSLLFPSYEWKFELSGINYEDKNFIFTYRGHGNTISSVMPDFSLNDINYLNFTKNGIFLFFSCLMGNFDKEISGYQRSFSESILVSSKNVILTLSSSSETFYQYNNYMMNKFFDFLDDNSFKIETTEKETFFLELYKKLLVSFINYAGVNDYSISQVLSYNIFGFPLLSLNKNFSFKPFSFKDSVDISDSILKIEILNPCRLNVFSKEKIIDTFDFKEKTTLSYKLFNIKPNSFYYISSYLDGVLFIDSFFVKNDLFSIDTFFFSDTLGNNNGLIEEGEPIQIFFKTNKNDYSKINIFSTDCDIVESLSFDGEFFKTTIKTLKGVEKLNLNVLIDSYNFYFILPVNIFRIIIDSLISLETPIFYKDKEYQIGVSISSFNIFPQESLKLKFIEKNYFVTTDSIILKTPFKNNILWNYFTFFDDTNFIKIEYSNGYIYDTISYKVFTTKKHSVFFYDPLNNYQNTVFVSFLKDSLDIFLSLSNKIDSSFIYSSYIFSFGVYPKLHHINSEESKFIENLASKNIPLLVEGGDVFGYDREGIRIKELFNIKKSFDGNYLYKGTILNIELLDIDVIYDTTSNYMDYYETDQPLLSSKDICFASLKDNRIAQSPLLKNLQYTDRNLLYYFYTIFLLDFEEGLSFKETVDISINKSFEIFSTVKNPQILLCEFPTNLIDSIKFEDGRIIESLGKRLVKIFVKRNSPPFFTKIFISTGLKEYTLFLKYSPYIQTKKKDYENKENISDSKDTIYFDKIGRRVLKNELRNFNIYFNEKKKVLILKK